MASIYISTLLIALLSVSSQAEDICEKAVGNLFNHQSQFTGCVLKHSEPSTFCRNCSEHRTLMISAYTDLLTKVSHGIPCRDIYINNHLNLVENLYQNTLALLWDGAFCNDCFATIGNHSIVYSNTTAQFFNFYSDYENCTAKAGNETVCIKCQGRYERLSEYYDTIRLLKEDKICFDITDQINKTRKSWSSDYKCCNHESTSLSAFYVAAGIVGSIPFCFYLTMMLHTRRSEQNEFLLNDGTDAEDATEGPSTSGQVANVAGSSGVQPSNQNVNKTKTADSDDDDGGENVAVKRKPAALISFDI